MLSISRSERDRQGRRQGRHAAVGLLLGTLGALSRSTPSAVVGGAAEVPELSLFRALALRQAMPTGPGLHTRRSRSPPRVLAGSRTQLREHATHQGVAPFPRSGVTLIDTAPRSHQPLTLTPLPLPAGIELAKLSAGPGTFGSDTLDRLKMRLDGMGTYAVVAALVVNMGIRLLSSTSDLLLSKVWSPIACLYSCSLAGCVLSGVYATIVFALVKMFSKTALGIYKDVQFCEFFNATAHYRVTGFVALCISVASFCFAFLTFFLVRVGGAPGVAGFIVGMLLVAKGIADFWGICRCAGRIFQ